MSASWIGFECRPKPVRQNPRPVADKPRRRSFKEQREFEQLGKEPSGVLLAAGIGAVMMVATLLAGQGYAAFGAAVFWGMAGMCAAALLPASWLGRG